MREVTEEVDEAQERGKEEEARERPTSSTTDNTPPPNHGRTTPDTLHKAQQIQSTRRIATDSNMYACKVI